jgi:peptide-methionine (R)-S-oxide reductase
MSVWQAPFIKPCYMASRMNVTECNRRAFIGLGASTLLAGAAIFSSGEARAAFEVQRSEAEWRKRLGPARFHILRKEGTERPFTSPLLKEHRKGIFACAGCGLPLFGSTAKFDSGTGWPSFWKSLPNAVAYRRDGSLGMIRTEEHCRRCGGHLGHVFDDGPRPTGKRHCINGLSLIFRPA